ncbi:ARM repeat-containing protein [Suillus subalutaceus]|uniref:ARM repeat-containing protein n=1 Tax=Suillus subalutaceus TaxID=48586 RepID=UPI001B883814|nr:ARM repeat-containing protein [Suillus subalutaceus]KAG1835923.1 ARM repeat-containing protein [Suillus subalutaceus]
MFLPPPPSALLTARVIENLSEVAYPEGIKSPRIELNVNVRDGRFRYDHDFLMQFMHICKEKPPTLPALDVLGIEPVDQVSFPMARGGSGRRSVSGAMPVSANRQGSAGLGIGGFQKPPSGYQMGDPLPPGRLTSEERFAILNSRSSSTSSASSQFRSPMVRTPGMGGSARPRYGCRLTRAERRVDPNKIPVSQKGLRSGCGAASILGAGFEPVVPLELSANRWVPTRTTRKAQPDVDSPDLVDRKVKALLNKLSMEKFETISDQIIHWANRSVNEKDGRTLTQVIRLVFEKATDEAAWSEVYARLCRKMMEQISPEVQDDGIKNTEGEPIAGGQLFRKYLLNRCQEDFERGWFAKEAPAAAAVDTSDDHATKAANDKKSTEKAELYSNEYYAAQKAKRQGLGLIKFIGELFKLQMLTERIMHECVKQLLVNVENPEEEKIESLCQLLKTVGQLLDTPRARAHMDIFFSRMKELGKSHNISTRMQFMLQDVIELRDRAWMSRDAAPMTIAAIHTRLAAEEKATAEECFNRQMNMSRGRSRRGDDCNQEDITDGWVVVSDYVPQAPPKAVNEAELGKSHNISTRMQFILQDVIELRYRAWMSRDAAPMTIAAVHTRLAAEEKATAEECFNRQLNMSRGGSRRGDDCNQEDNPDGWVVVSDYVPQAPRKAGNEADVKKKIDEDVKEFFAVRSLQEAEVYFNLPDEHRFRLVDKLVASALESKEADARLVGDFFAQATSNGQCTLEAFEKGFMSTAELLNDVAIDTPNAFDYMAIMLRGAGFQNEPERLYRIASKLECSDKLVSLVA